MTPSQEELVSSGMGLVWHLLKKMRLPRRRDLDVEDFIGEGLLALVQSARLYDPSRGVSFSTYACRAIRNAFLRLLELHARRPGTVSGEWHEENGFGCSAMLEQLPDRRGSALEAVTKKSDLESIRAVISRAVAGLSTEQRRRSVRAYLRGEALGQKDRECFRHAVRDLALDDRIAALA